MNPNPNRNLNDFRCMRDGKQLEILSATDERLLNPIQHIINPERKQKALLLLHGFSSSPAVFRHFTQLIQGYDIIVAPTLPGHGSNLQDFANTHALQWLDAVEAAYVSLEQEYEAVDVLGLSMGGLLACHLGARFKPNHLYLLAPALDLHLAITPVLALTNTIQWLGFTRYRSLAGNIHQKQHCEIAYRQLPLSTIHEILTLIQGFELTLPSCPTDLFLGRYDEVVACELVAERFADHALTKIHWLDNSAHVLPLDGDADVILNCINHPV